MRLLTPLAALLVPAVVLSGQPAMAAAPATIAHAQLTGGWELVLTNGDVVKVPEAFVTAPMDAISGGSQAPLLVSRDGRHFFYYRKSDGVLVGRTLGGKEKVVSRSVSVNTVDEEWPTVSDDGSYVVTHHSGPGLGIFADLRTGKTVPLPGREDSWWLSGFSPDSKRLLMATSDKMTVFDRGLRVRMQLKTEHVPEALANDYVTGAAPVGKPGKYRKLRLVNLRTGRAGKILSVRLPSGRYIDDLYFDKAGRLLVRSKTTTGVAVYRVSKSTGGVTRLRTIARPDVKMWVLPGDQVYENWTRR